MNSKKTDHSSTYMHDAYKIIKSKLEKTKLQHISDSDFYKNMRTVDDIIKRNVVTELYIELTLVSQGKEKFNSQILYEIFRLQYDIKLHNNIITPNLYRLLRTEFH